MKIYQIHEYGGFWEDRFDDIVGSYLSEEKALAEKERLEKEEGSYIKQMEKCSKCPLYNRNRNINDVGKYCDNYEPFEEGVRVGVFDSCTSFQLNLTSKSIGDGFGLVGVEFSDINLD